MPYYGEDVYDYERPGNRRSRYSAHYLGTDVRRERARSHGASPVPIVNIYNDQVQDVHQRNDSPPYPPYAAQPPYVQAPYAQPAPPPPPPQVQFVPAPQPMPMQYQPVPQPVPVFYEAPHRHHRSSSSSQGSRGRGHSRIRDDLVEDMAEMVMRDRYRSRSRGRSDVGITERPEFYEWQLQQVQRENAEKERRLLMEREFELKRIRDENDKAKAKEVAEEREKQAILDYEEKKRKAAEKAKKEEQEIRDKIEREAKEAKEKAKREEQELRDKIEREAKEAKEKKELQRQQFLREEREREEKEKAEKKAEKEKFENEMRRRLENLGYTQAQIDFMVDEERTKKYKEGGATTVTTETSSLQVFKSRAPVYPKIHRDYLSVETLRYYNIEYEKDPSDPNYFIVLREMDKYETEVLFAHTRRLREGKLLIEDKKEKDKNYAWFRKRDRSKSRVREIGILEYKR